MRTIRPDDAPAHCVTPVTLFCEMVDCEAGQPPEVKCVAIAHYVFRHRLSPYADYMLAMLVPRLGLVGPVVRVMELYLVPVLVERWKNRDDSRERMRYADELARRVDPSAQVVLRVASLLRDRRALRIVEKGP